MPQPKSKRRSKPPSPGQMPPWLKGALAFILTKLAGGVLMKLGAALAGLLGFPFV